MKTMIVLTGLSLGLLGTAPASATSINYNRPFTNACFDAASLQRSPSGLMTCNTAIASETTTGGDERAANLVNRGILLLLADRAPEAGRDFDEALALNPHQPEALLGKAIEQWKAGHGAEAANLASQSLQYGPKRPAVAYLVRGLANEQQGQLRAAYQDLQAAQRLEPGWADPANELARYKVVSR